LDFEGMLKRKALRPRAGHQSRAKENAESNEMAAKQAPASSSGNRIETLCSERQAQQNDGNVSSKLLLFAVKSEAGVS
jgi:hypothetical protein